MTDDRLTHRLSGLMHELAIGDEQYIDDILARTVQTHQRPAWAFPTRWVPAPAVLEWLPAYQNRLVLALLLAGMLALLLGTAAFVGNQIREQLPSSQVSNGWIAVSANPWTVYHDEAGDIYLLQEGAPARRIIGSEDDGVAQACPRFSPDGRRLAYGEAASGARVPVTRESAPVEVEDRAAVVVELDASGEPSSPILRVPISTGWGEMPCPEWSPSGEQLAFRSDTELWVIDSGSGHSTVYPVNRAIGEQGFEWSRDGSRIAVAEIGDVRIVALDGTESRAIPVISVTPRSLGWIAGNRIVFMTAPGSQSSISVIDLDGNRTQLAHGDADTWFHDLAVSRNGTRIAYVQETQICTRDSADGDSCRRQPQRVLVVAADGSDVVEVPLASGFDGAYNMKWSPDGERLLFVMPDVVMSVPLSPNSGAIFHSSGELNLEWSASEVTWQPVFP
jgi:dipeptidyl aminopeptidase/acylaminoacyl peptidase